MSTSSMLVQQIVSSTGAVFSDSFPLFYLVFGLSIALLALGFILRGFKTAGRKIFH